MRGLGLIFGKRISTFLEFSLPFINWLPQDEGAHNKEMS